MFGAQSHSEIPISSYSEQLGVVSRKFANRNSLMKEALCIRAISLRTLPCLRLDHVSRLRSPRPVLTLERARPRVTGPS